VQRSAVQACHAGDPIDLSARRKRSLQIEAERYVRTVPVVQTCAGGTQESNRDGGSFLSRSPRVREAGRDALVRSFVRRGTTRDLGLSPAAPSSPASFESGG
jgi:hypothetical protein